MGRNGLRVVLLGLIGLVAVGAFLTGQRGLGLTPATDISTASTVRAEQCAGASGVSVVIDFGALRPDAQTVERCVQAPASITGWHILKAAGFKVSGTELYPTGFVCRIDGQPSEQIEKCADTPLVSLGSWAYFYADERSGNTWVFSGAGAGMRKPSCGSVEGWRFVAAGESATTPPVLAPKVQRCSIG